MRALVVACALASLCACAKTQLITEPGARIYVDGVLVGQGRAEIRRNGIPSAVQVEVEADDGRRKQVVLKRSFTAATAGIGLITYGIGLLTFWQHPAGVRISLPGSGAPGWDDNGRDPWLDGAADNPWPRGPVAAPAP